MCVCLYVCVCYGVCAGAGPGVRGSSVYDIDS